MKHKVAWQGTRTVEDCRCSLPEPVLVIYGNGPAIAYGPVEPDQIEPVLRAKCENHCLYDFTYHVQGKVLARDRGFCFPNRPAITRLYEDTKPVPFVPYPITHTAQPEAIAPLNSCSENTSISISQNCRFSH